MFIVHDAMFILCIFIQFLQDRAVFNVRSNALKFSVMCRLRKVQDVDASLLSIHPACVVSVSLSHLKTESVRQRKVFLVCQ